MFFSIVEFDVVIGALSFRIPLISKKCESMRTGKVDMV